MSTEVYLSLGSNLGDRRWELENGLRALRRARISGITPSSIYETEPIGHENQPWFLNVVARGRTRLSPRELLKTCKRIEHSAGRKESIRYGPRPLDIDILLYGTSCVTEEDLVIPHPQMDKRRFVLVPLLEISPDTIDPRNGRRFSDLLSGLDEGRKVRKSIPRES